MGKAGTYIRTDEIKKKMSEGSKKRDAATRPSGENHPNYVADKNHNCIDCGKKLRVAGTQRCWECYVAFNRGKNHYAFKDGMRSKKKILLVEGICDQCGKKIIQSKSDYNKVEHHFCNKECNSLWLSINKRGSNSHSYKNGNTDLNRQIRLSYSMREWKKSVFARDNYTCQECGDRSEKGHPVYLEAHHIKEFAKLIKEYSIDTFEDAQNCDELWNIDNGLTLCRQCHNKTKKGGYLK